ncbi:branched-chain amino acid ABC transporter permease [Bradyrhizobium sp. DOA9]|uniref:branched-chain amino acid ABC transporter permease n=1 Tax=Bradyrhizobium sp. DOA9 TaxID=1126627 RepID=UPI000468053A|nr:branched-chain amino acid ABC transporter permease [Bradyrhizobium sp. DOA9]GAJ37552.1 high-affinity branched-chain amino acid transport system permease protein BraD [Bradyrhizobium sp. DOA9]
MNFSLQLLSGLAVGCIYSLVAVGFSMVYRAMGLVNFAQGDLMMIGAFIGYSIIVNLPGLPFWLVVPLAAAITACLGYAVAQSALWPAMQRGASQTYLVLLTLGIGIILSNGARLVWGANPLVYPIPLTHETLRIWDYPVPAVYPFIALTMVALIAGLNVLFTRTWIGLSLRAAADDAQTASVMGVNHRLASAISFALAAGIGAAAGVLYAPITFVSADMGMIGIKAFAAAVLGSLGSIPGSVIGGFVIGIGETLGGQLVSSEYQDSLAFLLMIGILLIKPTGLMGRKG